MIIKPKLYKIALVSIAMVLMLVSTTGAFPFCGCWDHSYNDKSFSNDNSCNKASDSNDKCSVFICQNCNCPTCPNCTCPTCTCPTFPAPALSINKKGNVYQNISIIYRYNLTNTGNVPLTGIVIYDNKTSPTGRPVTTITTLDPDASVIVNTTYTASAAEYLSGSVTNSV